MGRMGVDPLIALKGVFAFASGRRLATSDVSGDGLNSTAKHGGCGDRRMHTDRSNAG